jgi:hypothetical protein
MNLLKSSEKHKIKQLETPGLCGTGRSVTTVKNQTQGLNKVKVSLCVSCRRQQKEKELVQR